MFFSLMKPGMTWIKSIHLYNCTPFCLSSSLVRVEKETKLLEVLLALPFGVHGIENRLSLCLIPFSELVNLPLHLRVQTSHPLLQFLVGEKLQLQDMVVYLYYQVSFFIMPRVALLRGQFEQVICRCKIYKTITRPHRVLLQTTSGKKCYLQNRSHVLWRHFGTWICCYVVALARDEISDSTVAADDFEIAEIRWDSAAPVYSRSLDYALPISAHYPVW